MPPASPTRTRCTRWVLLERGSVSKEYGRIEESIDVLSRAIDMCRAQLAPSVLHMRAYGARAFQLAAKGDRERARKDVEEGLRIGQLLHIRDAAWYVAMARLKDAEGSIFFFAGDLPTPRRPSRLRSSSASSPATRKACRTAS